jgi:deazaflavin-dependent oxidoreductase (nitroreductase family)
LSRVDADDLREGVARAKKGVSAMKLLRNLLAALILGFLAFLAAYVVGIRTKSSQVLGTIRKVNRSVFNPLQMKSAGGPGSYASVVRHEGRKTGKTFETPVVAIPTDEGFVISLPCGSESDWVKNVLAGGHATIVHDGSTYRVEKPEIVPMADASDSFPVPNQRTHSWFGVDECLRFSGRDLVEDAQA